MLDELMRELKSQADPLADKALADYQQASPAVRALLEQGMRQGVLATDGLPESFRRLLQDCEAAVLSVPSKEIDLAMQPYTWIGPTWLSIALGPGSLAHTYSDPLIAAVLMRTGNLLSQTVSRRLLETQLWKISVIKPGGMSVGRAGYINTLQVRLLHARVRATLLQRDWSSPDGQQAVPIDQWQMLRTWLDFTVVPFEAFDRIGLTLNHEQTQRLYDAWRVVGHLLGIDPTLLSKVTDHAVALELLDVVDARLPKPDESSRVLTQAMLVALGNRLAPIFKLPVDVSMMLMESLCRLFHGDEFADRLGMQSNWTRALIPMMADANRFRMRRMAEDPAYRESIQAQSLKAFDAIEAGLPDATVYQEMAKSLTMPELPRVESGDVG
ncbi:oxygenase MpaB family protein [Orrella daihaiensis]|uniref:DUF2236 domain-containing protein n=1 Tax=Orrella daihaiensis TaxID=2782176 RepID=A0ABY4AIC9_9BURK|nr:oxygenase MpaB family protein [Orrella daihaiensis]UOD50057.1 DUF2236 domain-containing protein [Orrella daihaiensis]